MSIGRKLAFGFGLALLAAIVVGVFLPSDARVERQQLIDSPAATVFVLAREPGRVRQWLPWIGPAGSTDRAPDRENAGGSEDTIRWQSDTGAGEMAFVESRPYEHLAATLRNAAGGEARSVMSFDEADGMTRVQWSLETDFGANLLARYAGLAYESRTGRTLTRGLAELATLAESLPRADWSDVEMTRLTVEPVDIAYLTATSLPNAAAISEAMGQAYFRVLGFIDRHGLQEAGAPLSISRRFSGSEFVFDAAIPVRGVTDATPRAEEGIRLGRTWGGPVLRARHVGSYRTLAGTHEKVAAWLAAHGIARAGDAWEAYVSDPARVAEEKLVTDVYYPIEVPD